MNKFVIVSIFVVALAGVSWFVFSSQKPANRNVRGVTTKEETIMPLTTVSPITPIPSPSAGITQYSAPPPMTIDTNKTYTATMVTSKGTMILNLFAKEAPITVNNYVFLARAGFYDNTVFHRIIQGFMIQGGDPKGDGTGGPGYRFADEPVTRDYVRGTLAMANAGPNTNGSQFFIVHESANLPKAYVIFGAIDPSDSASLATLDAIANVSVGLSASGENSSPLTPVTISSVTIGEK